MKIIFNITQTKPNVGLPCVHFMDDKAEVGIQHDAGGHVVVLAEFFRRHADRGGKPPSPFNHHRSVSESRKVNKNI